MSKVSNRSMIYKESVDANAYIGAGYYWLFDWIKPYTKNKNILNVGCWSGIIEKLLYPEDCKLVGIDIDKGALKTAKKQFSKFEFVEASIIKELPFKKDRFDVVLFFMTIEHIPHRTEMTALKNINNILKKEGKLFLSTPNDNLISNLLDPMYFFGHRHYSLKKIQKMLSTSGFQIEESFVHGGFSIIVYTIIFYFYKYIFKKTFYNRFIDSWLGKEYKKKNGFMEIKIRARKIKEI